MSVALTGDTLTSDFSVVVWRLTQPSLFFLLLSTTLFFEHRSISFLVPCCNLLFTTCEWLCCGSIRFLFLSFISYFDVRIFILVVNLEILLVVIQPCLIPVLSSRFGDFLILFKIFLSHVE